MEQNENESHQKPAKLVIQRSMPQELAAVLVQKELDSFSEFAELAVSWNADFRQLDRETFSTSMLQAIAGDLLFSCARLGCHVEQRGMTPPEMRTFAMTTADSPEMHWFGHRVGANCLLLFPRHREISVFSRPGLSAHTVSIPEQVFVALFESNRLLTEPRDHEMVFRSTACQAGFFRQLLNAVPDVVRAGKRHPAVIGEFREQVLTSLLSVVEANGHDPCPIREKDRRVFRVAGNFVRDHPEVPLKVSDLLEVTGVSERSLQYLFKRETGLTPKAFLTGRRLFGAHRELLRNRNAHARVGEIANRWGFWHMGQFAADYRSMFGVLPSKTLQQQ